MRSFVFVSLFVVFSQNIFSSENDTLMLVGKKPVTVSEFEYVYKKNNQNNTKNAKTLDEYLTLYGNFKLKVVEAESCGLDTLETFRHELLGYRNQLKGTYLTDIQKFNAFVEEAYQRSLEDVDVSHIFVQLSHDAAPDDTLQAYQKALQAKKRLETESFDVVARNLSDDVSVSRNGGHLGYITSMMTIYPFESAVYKLPIGVVSDPIRSQIGYHIILVHNRRPAVGEIHAKHILKMTNQRMSEFEKTRVKQQIDSISDLLKQGANFEELAKLNSDDKQSAINGGDLSWFGLGRMVREFETAAFALKNIGDVSEPILSPFGWHIIKLEERRVPSAEAKKKEIESVLQRDVRILEVRKSFVEKLKQEYNFVINEIAVKELKNVLLKTKQNDSLFKLRCSTLTKILFSFANQNVMQQDFVSHVVSVGIENLDDKIFENSLQDYIATRLIRYEDSLLEQKYSDFGNLMREYHDGILFFELSKEKVWDKATNDTVGLMDYFIRNKSNYKFETPVFKGYMVACRDKKIAKQLKKILKNANVDSIPSYINRRLNVDSIPLVIFEKGLWKKGDKSVIDELAFVKKKQIAEEKQEYPFVFLQGEMLCYPNDYRDVRGRLISDYQEYLEKEWVERLRKKYPVIVFKNVKESIQ